MTWVSGEWTVSCDICCKSMLASESRRRWDGAIVCEADYDERHPLDLLRVRPEKGTVPFTRPEPPDTYVSVTYSGIEEYGDPTGILCAADVGEADLMEVGQYGGMGI